MSLLSQSQMGLYALPIRNTTLKDQHGRPWNVLFKGNFDSIINIQPLFKSPLRVPRRYVRKVPNALRVSINYELWIEEEKKNLKNWYSEVLRFCRSIYGVQAAEEAKLLRDPQIIDFAGPRPVGLQAIEAASRGVRWPLGFTKKDGTEYTIDELPEWAKEILPQDLKEFWMEEEEDEALEALLADAIPESASFDEEEKFEPVLLDDEELAADLDKDVPKRPRGRPRK